MNIASHHRTRRLRAIFLAAVIAMAILGSWPAGRAAAQIYTPSALISTPQLQQAGSPAEAPLPAPAAVSQGDFQYFPQTAHFLRGAFYQYWQTHGATPVFGLPITEALVENGIVVQYLERARLEWHPEISADPRSQVLLTRLGAILSEARSLNFAPGIAASITPSSFYFTQTGHNLANAFLTYWQNNGGLAVFGYPISEEIVETSPTDGRQYTVQYFERNRFEWHPELGPVHNVQLGLLGVEYAQMVGLNPLARVLLPGNSIPAADTDLSDSPKLAQLVDSDLLPAVQALAHTPQFRWVAAVIVQNSVVVEFSNINEQGVAGAFVSTRSRSRPYVIVVPESERNASVAALASVLAHEVTHAYDVTTGVIAKQSNCSIEEELRAYMNGLSSWVLLEGPDALSGDYRAGSLDEDVSNSLRGFNGYDIQLQLSFDAQGARDYLIGLYGQDCGG